MSKLIALDDGHGMETSGKRTPHIPELGRFVHENEFNKAVVGYLDTELRRCGFRTLLVAPTDADTPLSTRINLANAQKVDAYISIHYNALDGKFDGNDPEGSSIHIYTGQTNKESGKLAQAIAKYLKGGTPQKFRGIIENDFAVLRETNMIAILSENGFMDNKREALLMVNPAFQKEVAKEHAQGICEYFGVPYVAEATQPKPTPPTATTSTSGAVYRVFVDGIKVGAFNDPNKAVSDALRRQPKKIELQKI
jgi:N-acetylmuramoyl-L-alanine amidase